MPLCNSVSAIVYNLCATFVHLLFRYSAAAGVRNQGQPDWGMFEHWLLDDIQKCCSDAGFSSPLMEYVSLYEKAKQLGAASCKVVARPYAAFIPCSTLFVVQVPAQQHVCPHFVSALA